MGIYLPCYDIFRNFMEEFTSRNAPSMTPYVPLVAGSVARSLACITCYPVELARTRMQVLHVSYWCLCTFFVFFLLLLKWLEEYLLLSLKNLVSEQNEVNKWANFELIWWKMEVLFLLIQISSCFLDFCVFISFTISKDIFSVFHVFVFWFLLHFSVSFILFITGF